MTKRLALAFAIALFSVTLTPAGASPIAPLPKPETTFNQGSLRVDVFGTAGKPNAIFLPGLTCGPWEFGNEIGAMSKNYRIYAVTLPGFDGQPGADTPLFATAANDVWALLAQHNISKPVLIGHSLGATLAEMLATQHPERLRGIVAIDGLPVFPGTETQSDSQREASASRMATLVASTPQTQYASVLKSYTMPYLVTAKADVDTDSDLEAKSDPAVAARWIKEDLLLDLRADLKKADVPYLLIAPYDASLEKNSFKTAELKRSYYASLVANAPHAQTIVIEGSRHFIMNDRPQALDDAIMRFLASLPAVS